MGPTANTAVQYVRFLKKILNFSKRGEKREGRGEGSGEGEMRGAHFDCGLSEFAKLLDYLNFHFSKNEFFKCFNFRG
jgi:hypothetical protein